MCTIQDIFFLLMTYLPYSGHHHPFCSDVSLFSSVFRNLCIYRFSLYHTVNTYSVPPSEAYPRRQFWLQIFPQTLTRPWILMLDKALKTTSLDCLKNVNCSTTIPPFTTSEHCVESRNLRLLKTSAGSHLHKIFQTVICTAHLHSEPGLTADYLGLCLPTQPTCTTAYSLTITTS
jgi:hypothetical protein